MATNSPPALAKVKPSRRPLLRALLGTFGRNSNKHRTANAALSTSSDRLVSKSQTRESLNGGSPQNIKNLHVDTRAAVSQAPAAVIHTEQSPPTPPTPKQASAGLVESPLSVGTTGPLKPRTNRTTSSLSASSCSSHSLRHRDDEVEDDDEDGHASRDASIRPITPSSLKDNASITSRSTSVSRTNHTYKSGHSIAPSHASTKPTTLLSVASDSGANRIATPRQADTLLATAPTAAAPQRYPVLAKLPSSLNVRRDSSATTHSNQLVSSASSIQFSALPSTPTGMPSAHTPSHTHHLSTSSSILGMQAPGHSSHHPRYNPHPTSPPPDNASVLTLASSTQAAGADAYSLYRAGIDEDASVRALPPSSRRNSQDSHRSGLSSYYAGGLLGSQRNAARPASLLTVGTNGTNMEGTSLRGVKRKSGNADSLMLHGEAFEESEGVLRHPLAGGTLAPKEDAEMPAEESPTTPHLPSPSLPPTRRTLSDQMPDPVVFRPDARHSSETDRVEAEAVTAPSTPILV